VQGDTTGQVHQGGQVNVPNQGGHPVPKDSAAEGTKQPLADFNELGDLGMAMAQGMMQDVISQPKNTPNSASEALIQDEIEAMEKQLKEKKAALAIKKAEAVTEMKETEEQDDLGPVSNDALVGGQAPTFDLSFLPHFFEQEHVGNMLYTLWRFNGQKQSS
jgi:hypothetical protein